jgi:hypothetical protein
MSLHKLISSLSLLARVEGLAPSLETSTHFCCFIKFVTCLEATPTCQENGLNRVTGQNQISCQAGEDLYMAQPLNKRTRMGTCLTPNQVFLRAS